VAFAIQNQRYLWNEAVYSQTYYGVSIRTRIWPIDWWQIWWPSVTSKNTWSMSSLVLPAYISVRTHNSRTDNRRIFKRSGWADHVTRHVWPLTDNDHWPRSTCQRSWSRGHETYQQLESYNSATEGRINFKLGENLHREGQNIWYTFEVSKSTRPE